MSDQADLPDQSQKRLAELEFENIQLRARNVELQLQIMDVVEENLRMKKPLLAQELNKLVQQMPRPQEAPNGNQR